MNTTVIDRRRRRRHSAEFKAEAVAACRQPGVSIAAVAMSRSVNANLLRRWVVEAERAVMTPVKHRLHAATSFGGLFCDKPEKYQQCRGYPY